MQDRLNNCFVGDDNKKDEIVEIVDKRKYEQDVSEYNKLQTFFKTVVVRNIKVLSKQEYDHVQSEYVKIINASEISNGDDAIADVWNKHNPEQVTGKNMVNNKTGFLQMMIETGLFQRYF